MPGKGCYRNGKFFLRQEASFIDQIEPESLRNKIIDIWPEYTSQITNEQLKDIINQKYAFDPDFREFLKSLGIT